MTDYTKYLGIKHSYIKTNCITLIEKIYKEQLNSEIFSNAYKYLNIDKGIPKEGTRWKFTITFDNILNWTTLNAKKIELIDIKEYDVILFKSKKNRPIHFGMYTTENRFIHVEEDSHSMLSFLNQTWRDQIHSIYRPK